MRPFVEILWSTLVLKDQCEWDRPPKGVSSLFLDWEKIQG